METNPEKSNATTPDANTAHAAWPALPFDAWRDTCATLQLWTQIVGKVRLARTPWLNHSWHIPFYVNARGLTTSLVPNGATAFEIEFDLIAHALEIRKSDGESVSLPLAPQSVADFYARFMSTLRGLGLAVTIDELPCEIPGAIAFSRDHAHASYDPQYANRFFRVLVQVQRVFQQFRTAFLGKCSPIHFFWGSCDLAVTRFSGRRAPLWQGKVPGVATRVMQEAYSHEVSSAGFWPGGQGVDASFYAYAYPSASAFASTSVRPAQAQFNETLGEFLLPYDLVRREDDPDAMLLEFLQSTYEAAANATGWDRSALECAPGIPGRCPDVQARASSGG